MATPSLSVRMTTSSLATTPRSPMTPVSGQPCPALTPDASPAVVSSASSRGPTGHPCAGAATSPLPRLPEPQCHARERSAIEISLHTHSWARYHDLEFIHAPNLPPLARSSPA